MVTHSSILAWTIPWTEEPGRSIGSQRVRHDWAQAFPGWCEVEKWGSAWHTAALHKWQCSYCSHLPMFSHYKSTSTNTHLRLQESFPFEHLPSQILKFINSHYQWHCTGGSGRRRLRNQVRTLKRTSRSRVGKWSAQDTHNNWRTPQKANRSLNTNCGALCTSLRNSGFLYLPPSTLLMNGAAETLHTMQLSITRSLARGNMESCTKSWGALKFTHSIHISPGFQSSHKDSYF